MRYTPSTGTAALSSAPTSPRHTPGSSAVHTGWPSGTAEKQYTPSTHEPKAPVESQTEPTRMGSGACRSSARTVKLSLASEVESKTVTSMEVGTTANWN